MLIFFVIRPTDRPQCTNVTDRQRTDSIGRTVLQTVAQWMGQWKKQCVTCWMKCRNLPIVLPVFVAHGLKVRLPVFVATSYQKTLLDQGHREFPFWPLKIPPTSPQNSRCEKHYNFVYLNISDLYWRSKLHVYLISAAVVFLLWIVDKLLFITTSVQNLKWRHLRIVIHRIVI